MKCEAVFERKALSIILSILMGKKEGRGEEQINPDYLMNTIAKVKECKCPACVSVVEKLEEICALGE